jgi:hypothetical protein
MKPHGTLRLECPVQHEESQSSTVAMDLPHYLCGRWFHQEKESDSRNQAHNQFYSE